MTMEQTKVIQALVKAQASIKSVKKDGKNDFHNYKYATLESYLAPLKPILNENGLAVVCSVDDVKEMPEGRMLTKMTMTLFHTSGESISIPVHGEGQDISKTGKIGDKALYKSITGGHKYGLANLFNIPTSDDPEKDNSTHKNGYPKKADMSNGSPMLYKRDVFVGEVIEKEFMHKKTKTMRTGYSVMIGGEPYNTTKKEFADIAGIACETGTPVGVEYRESEYEGYDLLGIIQL